MFSFSVGFFLRKPCFSAKKVSFSQFLTTKNEKTEKNRGDPIRGGDPERLRNRKTIFGFHPIDKDRPEGHSYRARFSTRK